MSIPCAFEQHVAVDHNFIENYYLAQSLKANDRIAVKQDLFHKVSFMEYAWMWLKSLWNIHAWDGYGVAAVAQKVNQLKEILNQRVPSAPDSSGKTFFNMIIRVKGQSCGIHCTTKEDTMAIFDQLLPPSQPSQSSG